MLMNHRQDWLRTFDESLSHRIVAYMIDTFRQGDIDEALVANCIEIAKLTPPEKSRLERAARTVTEGENGERPDANGDIDMSDRPWLPPEALAAPVIASRPIHPFVPSAQPAAPGLGRHAVVRVHWRSQLLPAMQAIAAQCSNASRLDIGFDDRASFGHFCAPDSPYDAVLLQSHLTNLETRLGQERFPESGPQPDVYLIGHLQVVFVVHEANRVESLDCAGIRTALSESGRQLAWGKLGGAGSTVVRAYGPRDNTWARQLIQNKCMTRWRDSDQPGVRHLQQLEFRDDLVACADAKEVIARVRADRQALGFFACSEPLTARDLQGVKVLPVAENARDEAISPPLGLTIDLSYPLAEPLFLYVHPNAPAVARDFGQFTCGDEAGRILQASGVFPVAVRTAAEREQRVADVKAGKGQPVVVCDMAGVGEAIKAAAMEFARAKMAVQVTLDEGSGSAEQAGERLKTGEAEWLVMDGERAKDMRERLTDAGGQEMMLGSRAVGVVVHPQNAFNELTMDDLRQILAGEVDRWPGTTGTAERIVLYGLPANDALMQLVDQAMGPDAKRTKMTVRPNSERVILSVASQPGALGLVDLPQVGRHETKVKLLAILPPGTSEAVPPARNRVPEGYPLARHVHLHLSPKASEAAQAFFAFLNEGGGREALLGAGLVPRPLSQAREDAVAAAYGPAEQPETAVPPAQVAAVVENDSPATAAPDHLHEVLRGALGGPAEDSSARVASVAAQPRADQAAEVAAASTPLDRDRPASRPRPAEAAEASQPARGDGSAPHPAASEPSATEGDFFAWITAHALPIGLGGVGIVAFAIVLGTFGMKRARHRKEVLRWYRP